MITPNIKTSPIGLTLRAYALIKLNYTGACTLISKMNVSTATRSLAGTIQINFNAALPSADYIVKSDINQWGIINRVDTILQAAPATSGVIFQTVVAGTITDLSGYLYIEVWG